MPNPPTPNLSNSVYNHHKINVYVKPNFNVQDKIKSAQDKTKSAHLKLAVV